MKKLMPFFLVLAFVVAITVQGAWVQEFREVENPPTLINIPKDWQNKLVPSGSLFPHYAYELFLDEIDWDTGKVIGRKLAWNRSSYYLPDQPFMVMMLQPDNTWLCIQVIEGPMVYFSMNSMDGDAVVLRLQAL